MQAVILAAGKSTRTYPLTVDMPKVLLKVLDKTLLEHNLDQLHGIVTEAIIIVGFKKEMIINALGEKYRDIDLKYVEQEEQLGTGHALLKAEKFIKDRFLVLAGDDLYSGRDIKNLLKHDYAALFKTVDNPSNFGVFITDGNRVKEVVEKPEEFVSDKANASCYILNKDVFSLLKNIRKTERGEIELTDALNEIIKENEFYLEDIKDYWLPVGYPWNLLEANVFFLKRIKQSVIKGKIEDGVTISESSSGPVLIGEGTIIKSGTYIEGPVFIGKNCIIGPHAYIRSDTLIYDNCVIRAEVVDSIIMEGTTAKHYSYIGHSVIGKGCNIAAGTISADYRHDGAEHRCIVKKKIVKTGRRKLGTFMGDGVKTGINTSIYPGCKIWPGKTTLPGAVVRTDIR
ncbi:MAG: bifunctional sugar-1-phosphate nucleotidylyltransferase/acetyltransferase [Candidatus Anammoxibacter sp.]